MGEGRAANHAVITPHAPGWESGRKSARTPNASRSRARLLTDHGVLQTRGVDEHIHLLADEEGQRRRFEAVHGL